MQKKVLLEIKDVCKEFPGVRALNNVSFKVHAGTVHSLMGENGAGKSTLMKCLFGIYNKTSGHFYLDGKEISFINAKEAMENGVSMVQQELNQALQRNVMDNLWLGRFPKRFGLVSEQEMLSDTLKIFSQLGISINPHTLLRDLSVSQKQMLEIARAVSYDAKIIVFDEPTSSLTNVEIEKLFEIINNLKEKGCGIIYISHKMDEILRISDEVTILRDGKYVSTNEAKNLTIDKIIKDMVGRDLTNVYPPKTNKPQGVLFEVEKLNSYYDNSVKDVSFQLRKGEILGFAGLIGAGRTETLELIFGTRYKKDYSMKLHGISIDNKNPKEAIKNGFALITEERRVTGIFPQLSLVENTASASYSSYRNGLLLNQTSMELDTLKYIQLMRTKTPGPFAKIRNLSGGNQQKVIIGRWLNTNPEVFLMDEPTRGIDVGAKYEIYQLIIDLANQGKGVIVVSSELPELLGITDRIVVMSGGEIAGIVNTKETNQEEIMELAAKNVK